MHMRRKRGGGERGGHLIALQIFSSNIFYAAHLVAWQLGRTHLIMTKKGLVPDCATVNDLYEPPAWCMHT